MKEERGCRLATAAPGPGKKLFDVVSQGGRAGQDQHQGKDYC